MRDIMVGLSARPDRFCGAEEGTVCERIESVKGQSRLML